MTTISDEQMPRIVLRDQQSSSDTSDATRRGLDDLLAERVLPPPNPRTEPATAGEISRWLQRQFPVPPIADNTQDLIALTISASPAALAPSLSLPAVPSFADQVALVRHMIELTYVEGPSDPFFSVDAKLKALDMPDSVLHPLGANPISQLNSGVVGSSTLIETAFPNTPHASEPQSDPAFTPTTLHPLEFAPNKLPTIEPLSMREIRVEDHVGTQSAKEDFGFKVHVSDKEFVDSDPSAKLAYSATLADGKPLPTWLSFDPSTHTFSGTPGAGDVGNVVVIVTATDGIANAYDVFDINVAHTNHAPVVSNALVAQHATEDSTYTYRIPDTTFSDKDLGDTLAYSATLANGDPLPMWLAFDPKTHTFTGTPDGNNLATLSVKVTASDGQATAASTFDLDVTHVNHPPRIAGHVENQPYVVDPNDSSHPTSGAIVNQPYSFKIPDGLFVAPDPGQTETLTYRVTFSDGAKNPDGSPAAVTWLEFDPMTHKLHGTPTGDTAHVQAGDFEHLTVTVTAEDKGHAVSQPISFTIDVFGGEKIH